jgi:hypothetical protein
MIFHLLGKLFNKTPHTTQTDEERVKELLRQADNSQTLKEAADSFSNLVSIIENSKEENLPELTQDDARVYLLERLYKKATACVTPEKGLPQLEENIQWTLNGIPPSWLIKAVKRRRNTSEKKAETYINKRIRHGETLGEFFERNLNITSEEAARYVRSRFVDAIKKGNAGVIKLIESGLENPDERPPKNDLKFLKDYKHRADILQPGNYTPGEKERTIIATAALNTIEKLLYSERWREKADSNETRDSYDFLKRLAIVYLPENAALEERAKYLFTDVERDMNEIAKIANTHIVDRISYVMALAMEGNHSYIKEWGELERYVFKDSQIIEIDNQTLRATKIAIDEIYKSVMEDRLIEELEKKEQPKPTLPQTCPAAVNGSRRGNTNRVPFYRKLPGNKRFYDPTIRPAMLSNLSGNKLPAYQRHKRH